MDEVAKKPAVDNQPAPENDPALGGPEAGEHAYRHTGTGEVYLFAAPRPDLEARGNFERVTDEAAIPASARNALARAEAERRAIEAASRANAQRVEARNDEATAAAVARATPPDGAPTGTVTGAHMLPEGVNPMTGVYGRGQVPGQYTRTELEEMAERDSRSLATKGVLARQAEAAASGGAGVTSKAQALEESGRNNERAMGRDPDAGREAPDGGHAAEESEKPGRSARKTAAKKAAPPAE